MIHLKTDFFFFTQNVLVSCTWVIILMAFLLCHTAGHDILKLILWEFYFFFLLPQFIVQTFPATIAQSGVSLCAHWTSHTVYEHDDDFWHRKPFESQFLSSIQLFDCKTWMSMDLTFCEVRESFCPAVLLRIKSEIDVKSKLFLGIKRQAAENVYTAFSLYELGTFWVWHSIDTVASIKNEEYLPSIWSALNSI